MGKTRPRELVIKPFDWDRVRTEKMLKDLRRHLKHNEEMAKRERRNRQQLLDREITI